MSVVVDLGIAMTGVQDTTLVDGFDQASVARPNTKKKKKRLNVEVHQERKQVQVQI